MKLAYFVNQYPQVSHTFIRREIMALERQGLQVERFALRGWDADVKGVEDLAERVRTRHVVRQGAVRLLCNALRVTLRHPVGAWRALRAAWQCAQPAERPWPYHLVCWIEACTLFLWLRQAGIDHVHAHFGTNSTEVVMLTRLLGGPPYSFTVHGPEEFDKPLFLHLRRKVEHAAFVVAISSYGRSQLWRWLPAPEWSKVQVVHCALEPGFFAPIASLEPSTAPRLINIGRLCAQKGQLLLIEAAACLAAEGVPFELVLAGDGEMRAPIEAAVRRHGLQDQVRITGWISSDTVRQELMAARALVMPSFAEGLPVVVMEAMAVGRPVIVTRIAGIPELVREGHDGWVVPPGSLEALVNAMRACLATDATVLAAMGRSARQRVGARHDVDVEAGKLSRHFRGVLDPLSVMVAQPAPALGRAD